MTRVKPFLSKFRLRTRFPCNVAVAAGFFLGLVLQVCNTLWFIYNVRGMPHSQENVEIECVGE